MSTLSRALVIWAVMTLLLVPGKASSLAQEDVSSAIVDPPAAGFVLLLSNRVDVSALDPDSRSEIADAWIKSFSDGTNSISILATQFADRERLRAGLAGAMSQIAPEDRRLLDGGVVAGPILQEGLDAEFAVYGEGSISFALAVVGPERLDVFTEAIATQLEHSIGEQFPLRIDEDERFLADQDSSNPWPFVVIGALVVMALGVSGGLIMRRRKGSAASV